MAAGTSTIKINRAPVLTLWAAVVAERLGFDRATALSLGQAVAGLSAYAKGVSLGIIEPKPDVVREHSAKLPEGEALHVGLLGRAVPVVRTPDGLRAVSKGKPGNPARIETYLAAKFGEHLEVSARGHGRIGRELRACRAATARLPTLRDVSTFGAGRRERLGCQGQFGPRRNSKAPASLRAA